jgi:hypothetical protein
MSGSRSLAIRVGSLRRHDHRAAIRRRALLVCESHRVSGPGAVELWSQFADDRGSVTMIMVADPYRFGAGVVAPTLFGPMVANFAAVPHDAYEEAARQAREMVRLAPAGLGVEYLVLRTWYDVRRHVADHGYERVLVAGRPQRIWDMLRVRAAGWAMATARHRQRRATR